MSDILDPFFVLAQRQLLESEIVKLETAANEARDRTREAEWLASEARQAAETALVVKEKRQVILQVLKEADELRKRLFSVIIPGATARTEMTYVSDESAPVKKDVLVWPATDDGTFVIAVTAVREIYIGKYETEGARLANLSKEELVALDLTVLQEILEHISQIGVKKPHVELPPVEPSPVELPSVERRLYNSVDSFENVDEVEFVGTQGDTH